MSERIKTIDYARFIAVVMVVFGHCLALGNGAEYYNLHKQTDSFLHNYIYSFHMPLFAVLSGWLFSVSFRKRTGKEMLLARLKGLAIPIISWQFLINVYSVVMQILQGKDKVNLFQLFNYSNIFNNMWFLWSMLLCAFLVILIKSVFKDKLIAYIITVCISLLVQPYVLQLWLWMFPFFSVAYLFEKNKEKLMAVIRVSENILCAVLFLIVHLILVICWNVDYYIYIEYGKALYILGGKEPFYMLFVDFYRVVAGVTGSIGIILFLNYFLKRIKIPKSVNIVIVNVSKYSLGIYVFSTYMLNPILRNLPFNKYSLVTNIVQTIIIILISTLAITVIDRIKILRKLLLGK